MVLYLYGIRQKGDVHPVSVKVGEKVLLPEYGGTKVVLDDKVQMTFYKNKIDIFEKFVVSCSNPNICLLQDYFLFRDGDILGKYVE